MESTKRRINMAKKANEYAELITALAGSSASSSKELFEVCTDFSSSRLLRAAQALRQEKKKAADLRQALTDRLYKEFLPPIAGEDLLLLSHLLFQPVLAAEEALLLMQAFMPRTVRPELASVAAPFAGACAKAKDAAGILFSFKTLPLPCAAVSQISECVDGFPALYAAALRRLYDSGDSSAASLWRPVCACIAQGCAACRSLADALNGILLKNL